jgi:hypothetical protein
VFSRGKLRGWREKRKPTNRKMKFKQVFKVEVQFIARGPNNELAAVICEIDRRLNDIDGRFSGRVIKAEERIEEE